jgi:hypothetical protein
MDDFAATCRQVEAGFDRILGGDAGCESATVMLIRAAARSIVSAYPAGSHRDLAIADLQSCAGHLTAMKPHA